MTISTTTSRIQYQGDGSTTAFPIPFLFPEDANIVAWILNTESQDPTLQVITTNYTLSGAGNPAGGTYTAVVAPAVNEQLTIVRSIPATQLEDYIDNDPFPADTHESALDKITMLIQQLEEIQARAIIQPVWTTDPALDITEFRSTENLFVARTTGVAESGGDYPWVQVEPISGSASWQVRAGGLVSTTAGNAFPYTACTSVPVGAIVLMTAVNDASQVVRFRFSLPGVCP